MIFILGCSWLPPCLPNLSPFVISILGCSWLPLPSCLPSLSPFMISILGCSWPFICLPSWSPFWAALGCRCRLVYLCVSLHGLHSWLPLPPCCSGLVLAAAAALLFWAGLGCRCRLVFQACLSSWSSFWAALGSPCRLVSQACLSSPKLVLRKCFLGSMPV